VVSQAIPQSSPFKAETRQLLDILIHSSLSQKEVFLRELITNASDALTRVSYELLVNRDMVDPEVKLFIRIIPDKENNTLRITDTGIGMTTAEMTESLGTVAQSGARAFVQAVQSGEKSAADLIGQFGVGFYSAFMVSDSIRVESRSFRPQASSVAWTSSDSNTYTIEPIRRVHRGTSVILKLRPGEQDYLSADRLSEIIRNHSNFVPFPIYIGTSAEQINRHTAIWRQNPKDVNNAEYSGFYHQLTLDQDTPLAYGHEIVNEPVQMSALVYIPARYERGMFSPRREDGLKLYAHKVLIQDYCKDLLPEYFGFVQGVVETDDVHLNATRETVQSNQVMVNLKKLITGIVIDVLKKLSQKDANTYHQFWQEFGRFIKEGVAVDVSDSKKLNPLLRFHTIAKPGDWISLDEYVEMKKTDQDSIYYILSDDQRSVMYSPHLDVVRKLGYDVLTLTDPLDAFMLTRLTHYAELPLVNVVDADLKMARSTGDLPSDKGDVISEQKSAKLLDRVKTALGERVVDVRITDRLTDSPARLVDPQGVPNQQMQRVYRLLRQEYDVPKKVLELNPNHQIVIHLSNLPDDSPLIPMITEQIYENALLIEGLHPDPAGMIQRIQKLMEVALDKDDSED